MTNSIKFSVIIPVYNVQDYLSECLDSIVGQTLKDIEIICVDNGSVDESLEILKKYAKRDKRIKILEIGRSNAGAARNAGLAVANGEFLYFIDSDDYCETDLLEKCYKKITEDKADVLIFAADQFDTNSGVHSEMLHSLFVQFLPSQIPFKPDMMKDRLFNSFQNWPWNKVFRHKFIKDNNISFQEVARTNDMKFTVLALVCAKSITILNEVLIHYRVGNKNSLQATNHLDPMAFWDAYKGTKRALEAKGVYKKYERSFLNFILEGCLYNYNSIKEVKSKSYAYAVIRYGSGIEFDFFSHDKKYYYADWIYDEYIKVFNNKSNMTIPLEKTLKDRDALEEKNIELKKRVKELNDGIMEIRNSRAYKTGMAITSVPRKIKSLIK